MRKPGLLLISLACVLPACAAQDANVIYAGGTVLQLKAGAAGSFDFSSGAQLRFVAGVSAMEIPYSSVESFLHSKEVAVHLGVAPAMAVGLVASRRRNHFIRITYKDGNHVSQVAVFEVPKEMPAYLMPLLEARSPQAHCGPYEDCTPKPMPSAPRPPVSAPAPAAAPAHAATAPGSTATQLAASK